jgi:hypothetical protein
MGDKQDGRLKLSSQVVHQFQNLRLNRHVEGCSRFVGNQQGGIAG